MIAYAASIFAVIGIVLSENRNPVKSLAWVTVLLALPAIGLLLYFTFGRSFRNKRYISRRNRRRLKKHEPAHPFNPTASGLTPQSCQTILLAQSLSGSPYYRGNSAQCFRRGSDKFEALLADIRGAQRFIYLEYYVVADDIIGREVAEALIERAEAGVEVKIIYDHVGSFNTSRRFIRRMRQAGIEAYPFMKVHFPILGTRINWRNHRKIAVIDGKVGYIGGMNIADRYISGGKFNLWHDTHLRVSGPIIHSLIHQFSADWNFMGRPLPQGSLIAQPEIQADDYGMQLLTSGPVGQWSNIAMEFQKAIGSARKSVWIQTPYFLPNEGLLKALQSAALAKVDVRIMLPERCDSQLLRFASFSYVKECLQSGIKIYLYRPGMLHSKMLIVDNEMVSIGSTNFDFRSFEHNFESNMQIYSEQFCTEMKEQFLADQAECTRVIPYKWARRPRTTKVLESFTRLFSPIL